jgi:hypothetical protein
MQPWYTGPVDRVLNELADELQSRRCRVTLFGCMFAQFHLSALRCGRPR